jgi:hypothetical protein
MSEQFSSKLLLSYITNHCNNCNKIHNECELNTILQLYSTKLVSFYTYQGYAKALELAIADNILSENMLNEIREFGIANL